MRLAILGGLAALALAGAAHATEFIETFTGTITKVYTAPGGVVAGDAFSLLVAYDTADAAPGGDRQELVYAGTRASSLLATEVTIDGVTYVPALGFQSGIVFAEPSRYDAAFGQLAHDMISTPIDFLTSAPYVDRAFSATGSPLNGFIQLSGLNLDIETTGVSVVQSDMAFPPLSIPEPAAWSLMLTGLGLAGASLRGRRKVTGDVG